MTPSFEDPDKAWAMTGFWKMHGCGNDFVVLDTRDEPVLLDRATIQWIGDRHRGIGFDQLLIIEPTDKAGADIFMRIYNPDGSEAGACGNGTRCVADLLMTQNGDDSIAIETRRGILQCQRRSDGLVSVDMGPPQLFWEDVPLAQEIDTLILPISAGPLSGPSAVGMGNPHCIFFVEDAEASETAVETLGPGLEHHPLFPERTNVEVASLVDGETLRLRVWERGAGVTLACGSGTCATVVAAIRRGLIAGRSADVIVDGGRLSIEWRAEDDHVIMTGPTSLSYTGDIAWDASIQDAANRDAAA